jgi:site-specific recombinase XerD
MKIHFYLDRRKGKTSKLPVFLHFWHNGQLLRIFTGEHADPDGRDPVSERIKPGVNGAEDINMLLESMESEVLSLVRQYKTARKQVNIKYLKGNLTFLNEKEKDFFSIWDEFIRTGADEKKWGQGMVRRLEILKMHLKNININYRIAFNRINEKFYRAFLEYHTNQRFNINYAARNLELFRWFMNWASGKGYTNNLIYRKFRTPSTVKRTSYEDLYLTESELTGLYLVETDKSILQTVRDMFCFACFTGLRYSDLVKLEKTNFIDNNLVIVRTKPASRIEIPLTNIARIIIDKYLSNPGKKLFPLIHIQKFNIHLKELGRIAGISSPVAPNIKRPQEDSGRIMRKWEVLSSLFARRTFINLGVARGISIETMCELTGNLAGTIMPFYKARKITKENEILKLNIF